jgi:cholesterol oxidase
MAPGPAPIAKTLMAGDFDAIVIGTGFGGAVTACPARPSRPAHSFWSAAGATISPPFRSSDTWPGSFRITSMDVVRHPGLWDLRDLDSVAVAQSAACGGGSLIYANVHLRPPRDVRRRMAR